MNIFINIFLIAIIIILCFFVFYYVYMSSLVNHEYNTIKKKECKDMRWGCCPDELTPKYDENGTNCRGF